MAYLIAANVVAIICIGLLAINCRSICQSAEQQIEAETKGLQLLLDNLTPGQHRQYQELGYFDVVGSKTGNRYRIHHGTSRNVRLKQRTII
jgi:hypothetical protein